MLGAGAVSPHRLLAPARIHAFGTDRDGCGGGGGCECHAHEYRRGNACQHAIGDHADRDGGSDDGRINRAADQLAHAPTGDETSDSNDDSDDGSSNRPVR